MNSLAIKLAALAVLVLAVSNPLFAEQRVLLSFDHAGHELKQVVRTDNLSYGRSKAETAQETVDIESFYQSLTPGVVMLFWTDADGHLQATTTAPDPRISRGPSHIEGIDKSLQTVSQGAWLVSGPQTANRLIILMAAYEILDLPFERWEVELDH